MPPKRPKRQVKSAVAAKRSKKTIDDSESSDLTELSTLINNHNNTNNKSTDQLVSQLKSSISKNEKLLPETVLEPLKTEADENSPTLVTKLLGILESSKNTLFDKYKDTMEKKSKITDELVSNLTNEVASLKKDQMESQKIQELIKENEELKNQLQQEINNNEQTRVIEKYEIITDMLESICGIRISDVDDSDNNNLIFNCVQGGLNGEITYQLLLSRTDVDNEDDDNIEMVYVPVVNDSKETLQLKKLLPDYFFESLTFPVETLPQFYQKLSRALNKEVK